MGVEQSGRWTAVAGGFLDLVLPRICQICSQDAGGGTLPGLCAQCQRQVPWRPPEPVRDPAGRQELGRVVACFHEAPVTGLLYRLKYGGHGSAAIPLAALLARRMRECGADHRIDALVPVPMHAWKRWSRGIDHAWELADVLARMLHRPMSGGVLVRRRLTRALSEARTDQERERVLQGAFQVRPDPALVGARVGLVDDVLTTGATARAASRLLRQAGAGSVTVLAVSGSVPVWRALPGSPGLSPDRRSGSRP